MKVESFLYKDGKLERKHNGQAPDSKACQLVIGFGSKALVSDTKLFGWIKTEFPSAQIAVCSTAGEIYGTEVLDHSVSFVAIEFEKTDIKSCLVNVADYASSFEAGAALAGQLDLDGLKHIFLLSDGQQVNGSELLKGITSVAGTELIVTGGLAGDGIHFKSTLVGLNALPQSGNILAIGFYGNAIQISHGSMGGWETFGIEKTITKSVSNELFEINHGNALDLYKQYLGKYAKELPGSALLFPLSLKLPHSDESVVRTILSINPHTNSMVFAGDVPEGSRVRFMKANFDRLIDASSDAAKEALIPFRDGSPALAILISCVGRKIILGERTEEEVEAILDVVSPQTIITGFYSYGEISPLNGNTKCELHNQTMTITMFNET